MDPILNSYFLKFKSSFEIDTSSNVLTDNKRIEAEKRKNADAFEKFVNYVLFSLDDPDVFTANPDLLESVSVGGAQDTGIDGLGIKMNGQLVQSIDDVKQISEGKTTKKLAVEFVFIQSKNRPGMDVGEFQKFGQGIRNFFASGYLPENQMLLDLRKVKDFILSDERVIAKLEKNPSLYAYYVSIGPEPDDSNFEGARKFLASDLEKGYFDSVTIKPVGGAQLAKYYRELDNKFEKSLNIKDILPLIVDNQEKVAKAYAFTCGATEFLKLLEKDDGLLRRSLFNDNVRDYLGNKGAINSEIEKTITDSPEMFLLRNNGVTIVCTDFKQVRDKLVTFENPQIVNGCQTSSSIFNLRMHPNISRVQILVRVISTEDLDVSNSIVRGTNKQNQVLDEAFEATLSFHQDQLEPYFLATGEGDGKLYYERRSKQYNEDPKIKRSQIVNLKLLTQTFVSMFLGLPHEAFRHEAKLLEQYAGPSETRRIFRSDHSPSPYYTCALTWHMFDKAFREYAIDRMYQPYKMHLYFVFARLIGWPPSELKPSSRVDQYCDKMKAALQPSEFEQNARSAVSHFDGTMKAWLALGKSRYGIKDSKEFTDLLQRRLAKPDNTPPPPTVHVQDSHKGSILRMIWKEEGHWFGFISRGAYDENVFFNNRAYSGDLSRLVPGVIVEYEMEAGTRAKHVVILTTPHI